MLKKMIKKTAATVIAAATLAMPLGNMTNDYIADAASNIIYCSPNGTGDGSTASKPTTVASAIKSVSAGGYIYLLEGTYKFSSTIKIDSSNSGSSGKYKTMAAYNGADVTFDFSSQSTGDSNRGITLDGSYWHFYGFEIANAGDNGMLLSGNNNIIEMMTFEGNQDTGLQVSKLSSNWPANNLIKNCTSKNNCDDATMENADGFAAKLTCGAGNVFDGCIAYNNSDDGWDLYAKPETGPIGKVTLKNCAAFRNGFTEDGKGYGECDGNGFKLGGGGVGTWHVVENCLAFENLNCGFTDNNNPEFGSMKNCTAYNNGIGGNGKANYMVYRSSSSAELSNLVTYYNTSKVSKTNAAGIKMSSDKFKGKVTNALYYNSAYYYGSFTGSGSAVKEGSKVTPSDSEFTSLSIGAMGTDFHTTARNSDGSPNFNGFAETKGTYKSIGYHFSSGITQTSSPSIPNTTGGSGTDTPTPEDPEEDIYTAATFAEGSTYMIKNVNSGLYLEVADNKAENNANVQQWGASEQGVWNTWKLCSAGDGYYYLVSCVGDGGTYVLDIAGKKTDDGTNIAIYQYKGADNQKFMLTKNSDGSYKIRTKISGEKSAIEVASAGTNAGANVQQWAINGANCQDWVLESVTDPGVAMDSSYIYTFTNVNSGLVMDIKDGTMADNTNVQQWGSNGDDCQKWFLKEFGSGNYYWIRSQQDLSYALKAEGNANGSNIDIVTYSTKDSSQLFRFTKNLDGSYSIITHASGDKMLVEVASASTSNGANVQQWEPTASSCQKWNAVTEVTTKAPTTTTTTTTTTKTTTKDTTKTTTKATTTTSNSPAGKVTAAINAENSNYIFDLAPYMIGNTLYVDLETSSNVTFANGCVGISVTYNGTNYWVSYNWECTGSNTLTIDITNPSDISYNNGENVVSDASLITTLVNEATKMTSGMVQIWWANDSSGNSVDKSNVTVKNVYINASAAVTTKATTTTTKTTTKATTTTTKATTKATTTTTKATTKATTSTTKAATKATTTTTKTTTKATTTTTKTTTKPTTTTTKTTTKATTSTIKATTTTTKATTKATTTTTKATTKATTITTKATTVKTTTPSVQVVKPSMIGDVNLDGEIATSDIIVLSKYMVNSSIYPLANATAIANADVTKDGVIGSDDTLKIIEFILETIASL